MIYIGNRIREIRSIKKITTTWLAQEIGVKQSFVSAIENANKKCSLELLDKICRAMSITMSEFFDDGNSHGLSPEIKKIIDKAKMLPLQKIKILNDVLDTWVENELTLAEKPNLYKAPIDQISKQQNKEEDDIDIRKIVLVAEADGREEMHPLSPEMQAIVIDALRVSRQRRKEETKGSE